MKVGDMVEFIGPSRIGIREGQVGYIESGTEYKFRDAKANDLKMYRVRTLHDGKLRRFRERNLKVIQ